MLGVAVARRAASELQDGAGIASTSVAALLGDLGAVGQLPERCVLVVDEAAMVPTRQLAELLSYVEQARGKLVLVGDQGQLPELSAGGGFRALVQRGFAVQLSTNVRQVEAWEREALEHLRAGRAESALALYRGHEALVMALTEQAARQQLVRDWLQAGDPDICVMIARRRADVGDLNAHARRLLRHGGAIHGPELELPGGRFAAGDRVVIKRNDRRLDVQNGQRARVIAVDAAAGILTLDCGTHTVDLDRHFLHGVTEGGDPTLLHGYAITGHVAQGLTVDRTFVLAGDGINREWAYVALSRGRLGNRLYAAIVPEDPREEFAPGPPQRRDPTQRLVAALTDSTAQVFAIDSGVPEPAEARREFDLARRDRSALENRRFGWLPGRPAALGKARDRERVAAARLVAAVRSLAERSHAARPFVSESDLVAARAQRAQQRAERSTARLLDRGCHHGREL